MADLEQRLAQLTPLQRAVLALKETQQRLHALERQRDEPIAIVGMACRFPGGANDVAAFWRMLCGGVNAIREVPAERWDADAYYDPDPAAPGKMNTRWGGFIEKIDEFDNHFFSISDREATRIDPQHRMSLELTWEALEDAGIPPSSLRGSRTGVFVGLSHSEYGMMLSTDMAQSDAYVSTGTAHCLAANRVSFIYDFHGPSVMLDTACSSSLVAVHLACQAIRSGDAELAVAGGVNIILSPLGTVNLTKAGFSSADGQVRAFDAGASGYVRSEGGGLVILKPFSAALRDHDRIYAVIRGSAINQNGFSNGLTAPSRPAQESVLRHAYAAARIPPGQVQYVETQGTGTRLGDAIEALSLGEVLGEGRAPGSRCAVGSVKTNIGHLEAASGAASLIKVALALHHQELPPTINFNSPSPDIPFDKLPIVVQDKMAPWPTTTGVRSAGVSAFGFGGSNSHLVLTEAPVVPSNEQNATPNQSRWLTLSARTEQALRALADHYVHFLRQAATPSWNDICYTATARRDHHDCRLVLQAASAVDAAGLLKQYLAGQTSSRILVGRKPHGREPKTAFVFGAFAAARIRAIRQAIVQLPDWATAVAEVDMALSSIAGWTLTNTLADDAVWEDPRLCPPATTALQIAFTNWCRAVGIVPAVVVGTGVGEIAAAAVAGIVTIADALRLSAAVASGDISSAAGAIRPVAARLPCVSAAEGESVQGADLQFDTWQRQMQRSADWKATLATLRQRQTDVALTLGEDPATVSADATGDIPCVGIAASTTSDAGADPVNVAFGPLYSAGLSLRWSRLETTTGQLVNVPMYPWQKHRLWAERKDWLANALGRTGAPTKQDDAPDSSTEATSTDSAHAPQATETPTSAANAPIKRRVRPDLNTPYEAARTPFEADLVLAWCEILKVDRVGVHDNFFELGGDSLQAMILHNVLQDRLGEIVQGYVLFQAQTIDSLAIYGRRYYPAAVRRLHPEEVCEDTGESAPSPTSVGPQEVAQVRAVMTQVSPTLSFPPVSQPKNRRAVFVFSPPRSGSTLLRVMLAGHPQLFSPPELELLSFPTMQARKMAYAGVLGQWLEGVIRMVMEVRQCDVDEARQIVAEFEDQGRTVKEFYHMVQEAAGDRLLVDKTPSYAARTEFMQQSEAMFDKPLFVQLLRHPCGMIRSYVDYQMHEAFKIRFSAGMKASTGMEIPFTPYQLAELTWVIGHQNIQEFFHEIPEDRKFQLRFEEVVKQPAQAMRGLCDFLGLEYHEEMIHPYDHREKKMLDGVVAQDRMYGDQKFMVKHTSIDPSVADEWRKHISSDILGSVAREMALSYGYDDVTAMSAAVEAVPVPKNTELVSSAPRKDDAAALLGRLDDLSDAEVESLLQQHQMDESEHG